MQYIAFKGLGNDTNIQNSILTQDNWSTINELLFKLTNLDTEKAIQLHINYNIQNCLLNMEFLVSSFVCVWNM